MYRKTGRIITMVLVLSSILCSLLVSAEGGEQQTLPEEMRVERDMRESGEVIVEPADPLGGQLPADVYVSDMPEPGFLLPLNPGIVGAGAPTPPKFPSSYYGTSQLGGADVAEETPISAWIDNVRVFRVEAQLWEGDSVATLHVLEDGANANAPGDKGGTEGDTVRYKVGGTWANESGTWNSGTLVNVDLTGPAYSTAFAAKSRWINDFKWASQDTHPRLLGDVNGDGMDDVVGFHNIGVFVALSDGSEFGAKSRWINDFGTSRGWTSQNIKPRFVGDVNGDGMDDIVGFHGAGVYVSLSNGSRFDAKSQWIADFRWPNQNEYPRFVVDVNGDGMDDIVGFHNTGVFVALSNGSSFDPKSRWLADFGLARNWSSQLEYPRAVADANGDGLADVIGYHKRGVFVALSDGAGFDPKSRWIADFGNEGVWPNQNVYPRLTVDVNGDGRADIVGFHNTGVFVALSSGTAFDPKSMWIRDFGVNRGWTSQEETPRLVGPLGTTGRGDIAGSRATGVFVALTHSP
jgi:hypothetical protein